MQDRKRKPSISIEITMDIYENIHDELEDAVLIFVLY